MRWSSAACTSAAAARVRVRSSTRAARRCRSLGPRISSASPTSTHASAAQIQAVSTASATPAPSTAIANCQVSSRWFPSSGSELCDTKGQ